MIKKISFSPTQFDFITSPYKFTFCTGGYKFGKTFVLTKKICHVLKTIKQDGLVAEPTYRMNRDILQTELEQSFELYHINARWVASDSLYKTKYGNVLMRTQDVRESLEGHNIGFFALDEIDLLPKDKNVENWRVLCSKLTRGKIQFGFGVGTNEGFEFVYDKFYKGATPVKRNQFVKGEYKLFVGSTLENKNNLPAGYLKSIIDNYDENLVKRYIYGDFVNIKAGRVYTNFTDANKINRKVDPNRPIIMSWDVNYSDRPMSTTILQIFTHYELFGIAGDDCVVAVKGFYNKNTNSDVQCQLIDEWLTSINFNSKIRVYGDRVGHDRRTGAPKSHYQIVNDYFGEYYDQQPRTRSTRSIIDRVASVQYMLKNANGIIRYYVDIDNVELITDYEQTVWKNNRSELDATNLNRTDPTDSASYYFYNDHDKTRIRTIVN